jgi:hypothetical protein
MNALQHGFTIQVTLFLFKIFGNFKVLDIALEVVVHGLNVRGKCLNVLEEVSYI